MARITVEDCLEKIENQYDLVLLAKERTIQLNSGAPMQVEEDNDKRTIISLREIGDGKISVDDLEKNAILRLRKEPDEVEQLEETEVEENDDFEFSETIRGKVFILDANENCMISLKHPMKMMRPFKYFSFAGILILCML